MKNQNTLLVITNVAAASINITLKQYKNTISNKSNKMLQGNKI